MLSVGQRVQGERDWMATGAKASGWVEKEGVQTESAVFDHLSRLRRKRGGKTG